ncbi:MAG: methionine synthase, partial [Bdellovibrionales bacterium]|nr:hypothetical protein [Bdellovibrionales bacterium]NQZ19016.1 methionine synthase [Bdellovibrionales bacterium]
LNPEKKTGYLEELNDTYEKLRQRHEKSKGKTNDSLSLTQARDNSFQFDWSQWEAAAPSQTGVFDVSFRLAEVAEYIDWSPFFWTWELKGVFPKILDHPKHGQQAREIYEEAKTLLQKIIDEESLTPKALVGLWKAQSENESVHLLDQDNQKIESLHFLRQQKRKQGATPNYCLADFISPKGNDYMGAFVVTMGHEVEALAKTYEDDGDDYTSIMIKAIGDRLAEALAEILHKRVREIWGHGLDEKLDMEAIIKEKYRGIRPAPGYPACPEHTEKRKIWSLLGVEERIGAKLTENCAMYPASSVSGFYFNHPDSRYFNVGFIEEDQLEAYAVLKDMPLEEARRWLSPNLKDQ